MWALPCLTAPFVCFAAEETDTVQELHEIVVKSKTVHAKIDGAIYMPPREKVRTATDALDLLQKMQLPRISVNRMYGTVGLTGGGTVRLCINGVEVTAREIMAVRAADIIRIEYHDKPGVRYAGADAVIDYITRRHDSGGYLALESFDAIGDGKWASLDDVAAQYTRGKSAMTLNVGYMGLHRDNWVRDYTETWHYPDREVQRSEHGLPVSIGNSGMEGHITYSRSNAGRYSLSVRGGLDYSDVPNKEEGDRHTLLYVSDRDYATEIREHASERSVSPSLSVYYKHQLPGRGAVTVDAAAGYVHTSDSHSYTEQCGEEVAVDIQSDARSRKYMVDAEALYEHQAEVWRITTGLRHRQSVTSNIYSGAVEASTCIHDSESAAFGEYSVQTGRWGLLAGLSTGLIYLSQGERRLYRMAFSPSLSVSYSPVAGVDMRYNVDLRDRMPSLASLSDVVQQVQPGMLRRGNPSLQPFREVAQRFTFSWLHRYANIDVQALYRHEYKPVMGVTEYDGRDFGLTYDNQRGFSELRFETSLSVRLWADHLSVSVSPSLSRYFSHGNSYSHVRNILRVGVGVDFTYRNWIFEANTMSGAANYMYGEEITTEKDMNQILVGYKRDKWSVMAGVFNAFMKEYHMQTENMSSLVPYVSRAHCGKNMYGAVRVSVALDFGRGKTARDDVAMRDLDTDAGIVSGMK